MHFFSSSRRLARHLFPLILISFTAAISPAQVRGLDSVLIRHWHQAYFAEIHNDFPAIIANYQVVLDRSENQPADIGEWFKGTSYFAIARAEAYSGDTSRTREALANAMRHHFWNFSLVHAIDIFDSICGKSWIDSLCSYWITVREMERPLWAPQATIVLKPKHLIPGKKYPLIIALQGGNDCYDRLALRLGRLPDVENVILAIPPAVNRISAITNTWDGDAEQGEAKVAGVISEMSIDPDVDTSDISLLGFSQGSRLAYSYGFKHSDQIRNIIAFAGFSPADLDTNEMIRASRNRIKVIAISGKEDSPEFLHSTEALQAKAQSSGIHFVLRLEAGLPHGLPIHASQYCAALWDELHGLTRESKVFKSHKRCSINKRGKS
ncbi:MAG: hypothetical protein Q8916_12200 [Bacteroidota bacterium]|nr:hypothetical protein [Bacteroidota bacterium]MDP4231154.1 hypothetical protein [Bacteroidota bacterium]MDP4236083.1 hypothetical protein [Bacteroidota bacterium]